jgi:hypothetical protein
VKTVGSDRPYWIGDAGGTSITPGGVFFLKIKAPRTPPIVENMPPTMSQNMSATTRRAITGRDRRGRVLLQQVRGDGAAGDDPQAAAQIARRHERQRRQHTHDDAADERRLAEVRLSPVGHGRQS